jgi:glycine dehydrogenase subunit 1
MRYVPHTDDDVKAMLERIGVASVDELFAPVPRPLLERAARELEHPPKLAEAELETHLRALAAKNVPLSARPSFLGAGVYRHYIPAIVDAIQARGEFLTAYTPYQPEASQGTLQAFFEFQSMICELTGLDLSNASLYDGATALVEALMMVHASGQKGKALVVGGGGMHPDSWDVVRTYYSNLPYQAEAVALGPDGLAPRAELESRLATGEYAALAFASPTFLGTVEDTEALAALAKKHGVVSIQAFNPIALALLLSPGEAGIDIAVGDGQACGVPPQYGGPHVGLLAAREAFMRRLPGRVVGQTRDADGKRAYVLTLQTREQHIRRERATSNICTNVGLMALRTTIYLATLGRQGLKDVARCCLERAHHAAERIAALPGYALAYPKTPFFHELVVRCPRPARDVNRELFARGIIGGHALADTNDLLLCVTEMNPPAEIDALVTALKEIGR